MGPPITDATNFTPATGKGVMGDDIGAYLTFWIPKKGESGSTDGSLFVSMENASPNLDTEQQGKNFGQVLEEARRRWNDDPAHP